MGKNKRRILVWIRRILNGFLICAAAFVVIGGISFAVLLSSGKGSLYRRSKDQQMDMDRTDRESIQQADAGDLAEQSEAVEPDIEAEYEDWQTGWVRYRGQTYTYNQDILTFLIMGIDKNSDVKKVSEGTNGGQADAMFLVVLNPHDRTIRLIGVNRNTMTPIDVYNRKGEPAGTVTAQLAVQHGFGDGMEESCEYQLKAVRRLFYNLPVHGYCAVNMSAIATINDAVGGVDVTVPEDLTRADQAFQKGAGVHLEGMQAFHYLKYRDTKVFGSADNRLNRQKQYVSAFIKAAREKCADDLSLPVKLYQAVAPAMVTDITVDEVAYLASTALHYTFDAGQLYTLKGETVMGEEFEEFYADEEALYELILEVFYERIKSGDAN